MCFRNLPIEFDSDGQARLKEGLDDPWGVRRAADHRRREVNAPVLPADGQRVVMRIVGSHAFGVLVNHAGEATELMDISFGTPDRGCRPGRANDPGQPMKHRRLPAGPPNHSVDVLIQTGLSPRRRPRDVL